MMIANHTEENDFLIKPEESETKMEMLNSENDLFLNYWRLSFFWRTRRCRGCLWQVRWQSEERLNELNSIRRRFK